MKLLHIMLLTMLAGCSATNPVEMSCKAQFLYNSDGADAAVSAFDRFAKKHDYVVANNLATYLMLRGFRNNNKKDFDRAYSVLQSMDLPQNAHPLTTRYIALLKFMASANGRDTKPYNLSKHCAAAESKSACATKIASVIITSKSGTEGTKSNTYIDFVALYSRTHSAVFGSSFQLQEDDWDKQFSREASSCGTTGKVDPVTGY